MKFFALLAVVAAQDETTTAAPEPVAYGADCSADGVCADGTSTCIYEATMTTGYCQDCTLESRTWEDSVEFVCPGDAEMEGSNTVVASAMALVAAAAMMA